MAVRAAARRVRPHVVPVYDAMVCTPLRLVSLLRKGPKGAADARVRSDARASAALLSLELDLLCMCPLHSVPH